VDLNSTTIQDEETGQQTDEMKRGTIYDIRMEALCTGLPDFSTAFRIHGRRDVSGAIYPIPYLPYVSSFSDVV
jgi:hypothetical protein